MASPTAGLERAPIEIPDSPEALFRLWGQVPPERPHRVVQAVPQAAVIFALLGIAPFTASSVEAYQKAQIGKARKKNRMRMALRIAAMFAGLVGMLFIQPPYTLGGLILLFSSLTWLAWHIGESWSWKAVPIAAYLHPIPDRVRLVERRIAEVSPSAIFEVEYLEHTPDPFLVVTFKEDGRRHYIEVWDESDFNAPLKA